MKLWEMGAAKFNLEVYYNLAPGGKPQSQGSEHVSSTHLCSQRKSGE